MDSFLNQNRPPVYCPGCTHDRISRGLDQAFQVLGLNPEEIVIVTDIGCSGLFDTFFNVHALHGIHGRALTYASGLKLANPDLNVVVTMGDGGLGIGGAHVLASCRRNLDLTLIVLNNYNFGMTGGQYSATTPTDAVVGSEFLNQAEMPLDICAIAQSAGATYIDRCSGLDAELPQKIADAMTHKGFSIIETIGMCTGRYTKKNPLTPKKIDEIIKELPERTGVVEQNKRLEYGERYRALAAERTTFPEPAAIEKQLDVPQYGRQEVVILGSAGMRIVTAGDIVCFSGICAGLNVSMKNDYNITVLRGQSVSEILISEEKIGYTGIESPSAVLALSQEGVQRRIKIFSSLNENTFVLKENSVDIPETKANVVEIDFKKMKIKRQDWALASLAVMAKEEKAINKKMLLTALKTRFNKKLFDLSMETVDKVFQEYPASMS